MTAEIKLAAPQGYQALNVDTVTTYLAGLKTITARLGGDESGWKAREVGDGNLNLVFIVEGPAGAVVVKQALPYVRLVGESWPLPLSRAHYEYLALVEQGMWAAEYVPALYHHDKAMALTVMEYLTPHIILRKGLVQGERTRKWRTHIGTFLARTLFHTSDFHLSPEEKREKIGAYLTNTAMCKISEDLIFDEPYFDAPMNRHTTPQLDDIALAFRQDTDLKMAVQELKYRFMNAPEALLHGDLHTGSVMVTEADTRVIDPEFAFFGPMGFDIGAILANLFMAVFAQPGLSGGDSEHALWAGAQSEILWDHFVSEFSALWQGRSSGESYNTRLYDDAPELAEQALATRLEAIWNDALGFAGCKMIRRILGLAHVEDFEAIENQDIRGACEIRALEFARRLILERGEFKGMADILRALA
ncbi:MAG: S-methyl-5-thioribose kinase [Alphaproteobacteria bacterium]|nr:S-methyl-5-thioribose kinase [Alphaproteobacteria bacterium]